ncbi:hypothetical protein O6H91_14G058700 [Diphasiastrum complanatum]|uniref:Uncharacterized protein n=2 Tax=Diphasiastrum complanatum TaxID=34168 RepID=A0ACC2BPT3_DIPCM|nr:hypothetical protein O6H91_14G058700 [Diphasiastrum complanatum]
MSACMMQCRQLRYNSILPGYVSLASRNSSLRFFFSGHRHHRLMADELLASSLGRGMRRVRMMGGGPRTYPGGVTKWEWKRLNEQKKQQWEQAKRIRERQVFEQKQPLGLTAGGPKKEQDHRIPAWGLDPQMKAATEHSRIANGHPEIDTQGFKFRKLGSEHSHRRYPGTTGIEAKLHVPTFSSSEFNGTDGGLPTVQGQRYNDFRMSNRQFSPTSKVAWASSIPKDMRNFSASAVGERAADLDTVDARRLQNDRISSKSDALKRISSRTGPLRTNLGRLQIDDVNSSVKTKVEYSDDSEDDSYGPTTVSSNTKSYSQSSHLSQSRFDGFKLSALSIRALHEVLGYETMTIVQEATLPIILQGKDVLAKAKTGTGKTIAFLLPAIEKVLQGSGNSLARQKPIEVLVICPARELAMQAASEATTLMKYHKGLGVQVVIGGTSMPAESTKFKTLPCQVLVATPGRLLDHMEKTPEFANRLKGLKVLVLDEADRLLDMGFRNSLLSILKALPKERQTLLFSATIPKEVHGMSKIALKPDHMFIDTVGQEDETHALVKQQYLIASQEKILPVIYSLLQQHIAEEPAYKVLVFCTTANITAFMASLYTKLGFNTREIHSRKTQSYRTRVSDEFRKSKGGIIMFTSDVSARGVDYPDVTFVLQIGLPSGREQYIHRLGRTGRAGKEGEGMLLLLPWEKPFLKKVQDLSIEAVTTPEISSTLYHQISSALSKVGDPKIQERAYQSWLGYYTSCQLDMDKRTIVQLAAQFSTSIGLDEPPILPRNTIRKMGLNGVL